VAADRSDRRRVMLRAQVVMALSATLLALATVSRRESAPLIYACTALTAAATAFDNPARNALVPRLVPREDLPGALTIMLSAFQGANIGGPALAGVLIAAGHGEGTRSLALIYLGNAVSFLAVIVSLLTLKSSGAVETAGGPRLSPLESLREGVAFVRRTPLLIWTMTLDFFATFFAGSMSLLPVFADQVLKTGALGYGWLRAAPGLGALIGSLWTSFRPLPRHQGRVLLAAVASYGAATVVFGLSRAYLLTLAALFLVGLSDIVSTAIRLTARQLVTPDALRGRMTSVNMIFFMGGPQLGELEAGFVAWLFASVATGATVAVVSGGVATILVTAVVALATPVVREYRGVKD
jgi:MFS family permease